MNKYWRESPSTEYRLCLDALIATISDMEKEFTWRLHNEDEERRIAAAYRVAVLVDSAKERAAELAGRLYDKELAYARAPNGRGAIKEIAEWIEDRNKEPLAVGEPAETIQLVKLQTADHLANILHKHGFGPCVSPGA